MLIKEDDEKRKKKEIESVQYVWAIISPGCVTVKLKLVGSWRAAGGQLADTTNYLASQDENIVCVLIQIWFENQLVQGLTKAP